MKLPPREKWFLYIVGLTALFVACVAAFFSIMGISMLFSGAAISSAIMALSLEMGKIVSTTFLYRYWNKTTKFLRAYLMSAIFILVIITSAGIFGWLSAAYQSSAMQYEVTQQQVATLVEQKGTISNQIVSSKQRIDNLLKIRNDQETRMNDALNNPTLSRNPTALRQVQEQNISLIKQTDSDITTEKGNYNTFVKDTMDMDKKILDIKTQAIKTKDVITFKFVADAFGWELNSTVKWFIVVIIVVFDPLAVSLILAYNVALFSDKKKEPIEIAKLMKLIPAEPEPILVVTPISEKTTSVINVDKTLPKKTSFVEIPIPIDALPNSVTNIPIDALPNSVTNIPIDALPGTITKLEVPTKSNDKTHTSVSWIKR